MIKYFVMNLNHVKKNVYESFQDRSTSIIGNLISQKYKIILEIETLPNSLLIMLNYTQKITIVYCQFIVKTSC